LRQRNSASSLLLAFGVAERVDLAPDLDGLVPRLFEEDLPLESRE
jgi:hypothetical protein